MMKDLFGQWWYGGLLIPFLMTMILGGAISIWTGLFISRLIMFTQARIAIITVFLEGPAAFGRSADSHELANHFWNGLNAHLATIGELRDASNHAFLGRVRKSLDNRINRMVRLRKSIRAETGGRVSGREWESMKIELARDYNLLCGRYLVLLAKMRPDYFAAAQLYTFSRWNKELRAWAKRGFHSPDCPRA